MYKYKYKTIVYRTLYVDDAETDPQVPKDWELIDVRKCIPNATGGH